MRRCIVSVSGIDSSKDASCETIPSKEGEEEAEEISYKAYHKTCN